MNETDFSGGRKREFPVIPQPNPQPKPSGDDDYIEELEPETEERIVRMKFPVKYRIFSEENADGEISYTLIVHSPYDEEKAYLTLTPIGETDDKSCNVHIKMASVGQIHENEIAQVHLSEGKNVITFSVDDAGEYAFSLLAEHDVTIKEQML